MRWLAFTIEYRLATGLALAERIGDNAGWPVGLGDRFLASVGWAARIAGLAGRTLFENIDPSGLEAGDTILTWLNVLAPTALVLALLGLVWIRRNPAITFLALHCPWRRSVSR